MYYFKTKLTVSILVCVLFASCGKQHLNSTTNDFNNTVDESIAVDKGLSIVNQGFDLYGVNSIVPIPEASTFGGVAKDPYKDIIKIISKNTVPPAISLGLNNATNLSNNSGALVCYYNENPTLKNSTSSPYNKLNWIWARDPDAGFWTIDKSYYLKDAKRLPDKSVYTPTKSSDLIKICNDSLEKSGIVGRFLFYTESTRYYPIWPIGAFDYDRPIITADLIKNLPTKFRNIVAFGDSLSDQDNMKRRTQLLKGVGVLVPNEPYWYGRFTNGLNWLDHMSSYLGLSIFNWAYGSAESSNEVNYNIPRSFKNQIKDYIDNKGTTPGIFKPYLYGGYGDNFNDTLFSLLIGGNNYLDFTDLGNDDKLLFNNTLKTISNESSADFVARTVDDIYQGIVDLNAKGAKYFLIGNLPDLSYVPQGTVQLIMQSHGYSKEKATKVNKALHNIIVDHNNALDDMLTNKAAKLGITIIRMDLFTLITRMLDNSAEYGLKNVLKSNEIQSYCYKNFLPVKKVMSIAKVTSLSDLLTIGGVDINKFTSNYYFKDQSSELCTNPQDYIFWDTVHPTTNIHKMMAYALQEFLKKNF